MSEITLAEIVDKHSDFTERQWRKFKITCKSGRCRQCTENNYTRAKNDRWTEVRDSPAGPYCLNHYRDLVVCPVCALTMVDPGDKCCSACEDEYNRERMYSHLRDGGSWTYPEAGW